MLAFELALAEIVAFDDLETDGAQLVGDVEARR